jgi:hypothetical protein
MRMTYAMQQSRTDKSETRQIKRLQKTTASLAFALLFLAVGAFQSGDGVNSNADVAV